MLLLLPLTSLLLALALLLPLNKIVDDLPSEGLTKEADFSETSKTDSLNNGITTPGLRLSSSTKYEYLPRDKVIRFYLSKGQCCELT